VRPLFPLFLAFIVGVNALAWEEHFRITHGALQNERLGASEVNYVLLSDALRDGIPPFTARTEDALRLDLRLNKHAPFPLRLGEEKNSRVSVLSLLSTYSDEPDWGADENLFEDDEYPDLWTQDTPYVAVRRGTGSAGFRHMYFPGKFRWSEPIGSFQIPQRPVGEAPQRAELFLSLSHAFFQTNQPYWGYRFLAWTLHYLEDLYQPFHSRQTPSKRFIRFGWKGWRPFIDLAATANQITYYHLSYEHWANSKMKEGNNALAAALNQKRENGPLLTPLRRFVTERLVEFANDYASQVGRSCYRAFTALPPGTTNIAEFVDSEARKKQELPVREEAALMDATTKIFTEMGGVLREVVQEAVAYKKK
jgi:hypothetical protein